MKINVRHLIDFEKVGTLLEGFNKSTGFVTAILDLQGNVLSKSGWRSICTEFHRVNPETSKKCTISDTTLGGKLASGVNYHSYKCLNGLVDVAVPIVIKGEHIANLYSGQFFFEEPDRTFFKKQAEKYGFDEGKYLAALKNVPVVSQEKVKSAMDFLLNMTQMISDITLQKLEQTELNEVIEKNERILRLYVEHSPASIAMFDNNMCYLVASRRFLLDYKLGNQDVIGRSHYEVFPEISERWMKIHQRCLAGETISASNDPFPRADGTTDWVRWEIRPWYESEKQIGGIIIFSEVITSQIEGREALKESEKYNRMLFEQSAIGLALTSFDGRLVDINTTFSNIIGRTVEEAKALTYWDITPEKYQYQEQKKIDLLAKTGRYGPYEKEYIHKDGHLVPVRLQGLIIERHNEKFIWSSVEDISEQKKAELDLIAAKEEIEASEHIKTDLVIKFNEAQQSGKIGNWDWDMITHKVWWSDELYRIFDLDPKVFIPSVESNAKFVQPDDNGLYHKEVQRVIDNKEELNFELRIISGNGTLKYCNSRAKLEYNNEGKQVRAYGTFADITERKMAELEMARLFESEKAALIEANKAKEQLSQILERITDGFGSLDRTWNYTFVNEKLAENVGKKRGDMLGRNIWKVFPEAVGTPLHTAYLRAMEEQVPIDLEHYYSPLGRWFQHRFYPSPDGLSVFSKDITERKQTEEKIRENTSLIRIAAERAKLGGWNVDLKENRAYWSDEVAAIHEMPPGYAPLVEDGINFYAPEWRERIIKVFTNCAKNGIPFDEEMEIITSTGRRVWVRTIGEAVRDENGHIFKVQGAFQDITERKKAEENIRQLNEELEQRVLDRTAQLDAANKELEAFSYSVSHDLRAPLRHINGYINLLNERFRVDLPEKAHHYLDTIADSSKQMGTLIDDLLQFSRNGRQEVKQVGMDMNVLVKEVIEKIKPENESRNITWNIQDLPMVYGDFALMNQVWFNLLDNAVKYTRNQQTAKIIIDYKEEGKYFVFFVSDNGVGFEMKYVHKLFGVFQRLHSQTEFEGTGIGLANVQRIINKHGGRVWAEAEEGKGATFFFSLPKIVKEII